MNASPLFAVLSALCLAASATFGADVQTNWDQKCAKCHGPGGKGDTKMGRKLKIDDLSTADKQAKFTDEDALLAIKDGVKKDDGSLSMKPVKDLTDAEMAELVTFVRGLRQ